MLNTATPSTRTGRLAGAARLVAPLRLDAEARGGASHMLPMLVGLAPFGVLVGVAVAASEVPVAGWAGTWLIFSGSAHLAVLQVLDAGGGTAAAALSGMLVNARLLVYSASLAPHWRGERRWFRLLGAAAIVDPTWALAVARQQRPGSPAEKRAYYIGASVTLVIGWGALVTAGTLIGRGLPAGLDLGVAVPLSLVALVVPGLVSSDRQPDARPARAAAVAAGATAAFTLAWPSGTGLLASLVAGAVAGLAAERCMP